MTKDPPWIKSFVALIEKRKMHRKALVSEGIDFKIALRLTAEKYPLPQFVHHKS
jgi:hypothetical protein